MPAKIRIARFFIGLAVVVAVLAPAFAALPAWLHTWGATEAELARSYPGDGLLSDPVIQWTHGITIQAPPEQVWPWIAQIGDRRAAFYSYTFIENAIAGDDIYHNADRIVPELQTPQPGERLIDVILAVREVEPGQWLLAQSTIDDVGWTWLWAVYAHGADSSRLVVRMHIELPPGAENPVVTWLMDAGGFVMERKMLQGVRQRAEGRFEPAWMEPLEIALWLTALAAGLAAAVPFLVRRAWRLPLALGVLAVLALLVFTFVQPAIWVRLLVDLILVGGSAWLVTRRPPGNA